ncbi:flagellar biosynthesis protein FlhB [Fictibacillus terranigra]|uniref:Flagellar biosynthetic protein FlhB n=1 Tax=Fictibacillus terranigra TaxID=3058424 RepID=A0ABT8E687_9BACL|nr:flagellar biosynthesis protein FlhB [Fictibacillus sp. CENA-BCM004]MDN4073423.1 flagellar biosynthesis protein FlhB [Fictibacillus sp. CENA-BCM004]
MPLQLDLQYFSGEKTEKATPKKKEESKKKGQVAKSADVNTAVTLFAAFLMLWFTGKTCSGKLLHLVNYTLQNGLTLEPTQHNVQLLFVHLVQESAGIVLPLLLTILAAGVFASFLQTGFLFSTETVQMKLERLNPIQGFKKIYSLRAVVELIKSVLKISIIGTVTFLVIWNERDQLMKLSQVSLESALGIFGGLAFQMGFYASLVLLLLSLLDFMYQKFDFEKSIRMSKQDIKDEYKESEGDPKIKSKIKEKQRQMAMRRMMQDVPRADVIITNPTHYAIALKYDGQSMDAPVVVAKGVDLIAQKIKKIGAENKVALIENRPLARTLYSRTEIGDVIPEDLFKAVAEILAYVYHLKK